jgi:hypothetical protein
LRLVSHIDAFSDYLYHTWLLSYGFANQLIHYRYVLPDPLVQRLSSLNIPTFIVDRDQTVSQRFKPNSGTALLGEQPNPWNRFQLQDAINRHRGAKRFRR